MEVQVQRIKRSDRMSKKQSSINSLLKKKYTPVLQQLNEVDEPRFDSFRDMDRSNSLGSRTKSTKRSAKTESSAKKVKAGSIKPYMKKVGNPRLKQNGTLGYSPFKAATRLQETNDAYELKKPKRVVSKAHTRKVSLNLNSPAPKSAKKDDYGLNDEAQNYYKNYASTPQMVTPITTPKSTKSKTRASIDKTRNTTFGLVHKNPYRAQVSSSKKKETAIKIGLFKNETPKRQNIQDVFNNIDFKNNYYAPAIRDSNSYIGAENSSGYYSNAQKPSQVTMSGAISNVSFENSKNYNSSYIQTPANEKADIQSYIDKQAESVKIETPQIKNIEYARDQTEDTKFDSSKKSQNQDKISIFETQNNETNEKLRSQQITLKKEEKENF